MKSAKATFRLALLAATLNALCMFHIVCSPTEFGRVNDFVPNVAALSTYKFLGCGNAQFARATKTRFYPDLKADLNLRKKIGTEMLAKGYLPKEASAGVCYRKETDGFSPYASYVIVESDGQVFVGASHSKWPQFR